MTNSRRDSTMSLASPSVSQTTSAPSVNYESLSTSAVQANGDSVAVVQAIQGAGGASLAGFTQPDHHLNSDISSPVDIHEEEELAKAIALSLSLQTENGYGEPDSKGEDDVELAKAIVLSMGTPSASAATGDDHTGSDEVVTPVSAVQVRDDAADGFESMLRSLMMLVSESTSDDLTLEQIAVVCPGSKEATLFHEHILTMCMPSPPTLVKLLLDLARYWASRSEDSGEPVQMDRSLDFTAKLTEILRFGSENSSIADLISLCEIKGHVLLRRFERLGDLKDVESAIECYTNALNCIDDIDGILKATVLDGLGSILLRRFDRLGDLADLEGSIVNNQQAVDCTPDGHPLKPSHLNNLGASFLARFERLGDLDDLNSSIVNQQQALYLTPDEHPDKPSRLSNLGNSLLTRFEQLGHLEDLDSSIVNQQRAVDLIPNGHPEKASCSNNLGNSLIRRFERLGNLNDLNSSIVNQQQAVYLTPDAHSTKPFMLGNLGILLLRRFERLGRLEDLDSSIFNHQQTLYLAPDGHPNKPSWLNNLGISLFTRFKQLGNLDDLNSSIINQHQAVSLAPDGHPDKPSWLNNLGTLLFRRFEELGNLNDLNSSIVNKQQAVVLTPDGHPSKSSRFSNIGVSLLGRFERLGNLDDLDSSIVNQQQAVDIIPDGHRDKPYLLSNLGTSLLRRFERLEYLEDLNSSIVNQQQAVSLAPDEHPNKPSWLSNLASSLAKRFERLGHLDDLHSAVVNQQQAVGLTLDGHPNKPSWLNNLGILLIKRFERLEHLDDLDSSIVNQQKAVGLTPDGHPDKPSRLSNLGNSLVRRFKTLGNSDDLDSSIVNQQQAADLTPDGHPKKSSLLGNLSNSLLTRYECLGDSQDRARVASSLRNAALSRSGNPSIRFTAARRWAALLYPELEPYRVLVSLIPQVVWVGKSVERRYNDLQTLGNVVFQAVSAACAAGAYEEALEWLEQGRAIIWGQILQLRSPVDDLQLSHPGLAEEVNRIAIALDIAGTNDPIPSEPENKLSLEHAAQEHHRLAVKWESLLATIRELPGFADFLKPKSALALKKASVKSTIVLVNASIYRCDALLIPSGSTTIEHLHLTSLSLEKLTQARKHLGQTLKKANIRARDVDRGTAQHGHRKEVQLLNILKTLWVDIAKPILDHLGYTAAPSSENLPHITWCSTGPLAALPIHAAGLYQDPSGCDTIFNYIVSSYTPSLTALLQGLDGIPISAPSILAVTQSDTPGHSPLPGTMREVDQVEVEVKKRGLSLTRMDGEQATVQAVSEAMKTHHWVHLSCHGLQNPVEPTKSAFSLHDGKLELAEIMKRPMKQAELAYLSACQTASSNSRFPDESMHLAGGMFIAGYRSVVGTLWSIFDNDAPLVAQVFYEHLQKHPEGGVARALHEAVAVLRSTKGTTEKDLISWIPYIHIGH